MPGYFKEESLNQEIGASGNAKIDDDDAMKADPGLPKVELKDEKDDDKSDYQLLQNQLPGYYSDNEKAWIDRKWKLDIWDSAKFYT